MKTINIALLFVGSIIGAGFATGAEIVTFFGSSGLPTIIIAFLVFLSLFGFISSIIFLGRPFPRIFNILYFILFVAMTAGVIQIAGVFAGIVSLVISIVIVLIGFDKMSVFNTIIVMAIIVILIFTCVGYIGKSYPIKENHNILLNIFLYGGLNCCMFSQIIAEAKQKMKNKSLYVAAGLASVIIAIFVFLILNAIRTTETESHIMPLLAISNNGITFIVILLAMLTSQYSALFTICPKKKNKDLISVCIMAFICSFLGFEHLVSVGYHIIGIFICSFLFFSLLARFFFAHTHRRQVHPPSHR
jgi:uncharacterized membrane protein YkvI